ncbi:MAG: hypothetical protein M3619_07415 [Myxococcota bacterium]|nr:hypothetical protein [Myxococcota bacterium]
MTSVLMFAGFAGCNYAEDDVPADARVPHDAPDGCTSPEELAKLELVVSGVVTDLATGNPAAGVTVDIARAWSTRGFPESDCPLLGTLVTAADGSFGPMTIQAGPRPGIVLGGQFLAFLAHGGGIAPTVSDTRYSCTQGPCTLPAHALAAPSVGLAARWRAGLADGGMPDAATRGLVAFTFRELGGAPAAGVGVSAGGVFSAQPLEVGAQVRFLETTAELAPPTQATTTASGTALIGVDVSKPEVYVEGMRGSDEWAATGSIVVPGWIFVEDKTVYVPPPQ